MTDNDDLEQRMSDLEAELVSAREEARALAKFAAELLGRFAHDVDLTLDIGVPNLGDPQHDQKLQMVLAYNREAQAE